MPFGSRKKIEDLFSSVLLSQLKKYLPSGNLNFNYAGIFRSFEFRFSLEKILPIPLKLNFTTNTSGCYGLKQIWDHLKQGLVFTEHHF